MFEVALTAGTIEYDDTGGDAPVVVLLHGLLMDGSLWRHVVDNLRADHRCVVPTLPFGSHRQPMHDDADLSLLGLAQLVGEFLERLDLRDVTLAGNDSGLMQVVAADRPERLARLVITSCEAFDNFPPGLPGRTAAIAGRLPGGVYLATQSLRVGALRRLPITYGWMSKHPIPGDVFERWGRPSRQQRRVRRDLAKYIRTSERDDFVRVADRLRAFERPALVAWAADDRVMPIEHGRRLAAILPEGRFVEIADSYTLIPEDQPVALSQAIRAFVIEAA
ncbi:MAG: Pimeloyl-ACP methyl ester carboxylesterase [Actinomycetia bacterium]|nr:Pimeloyl-ACP methyl ester carboxylesterase [Actinomycetes bacterium]